METKPNEYEIPIWVLYPPKASGCKNLLVVGSPSATHIGMSTLRMEPQFMIMGHSAGAMASLAIETNNANVRDIDMGVLHALLLAQKQKLAE